MALSPDGSSVASTISDNTVRIWNTSDGELIRTLQGNHGTSDDEYPSAILSVTYSPDGDHLAAGTSDGSIMVWDPSSGELIAKLIGHAHPITELIYSRDGKLLASVGIGNTIRIWDRHDFQMERLAPTMNMQGEEWMSRLTDYKKELVDDDRIIVIEGDETFTNIAFSPDGSRLASGSEDKLIHVWDTQTGKPIARLRGHNESPGPMIFNPSGTLLASVGGSDGTVRLWANAIDDEVGQTLDPLTTVNAIAISPDSTLIATGYQLSSDVRLWDPLLGEVLATLRGHETICWALSFSPDGSRLASASGDGTVRVWDTASGMELLKLVGDGGAMNAVAYSQDGQYLAAAELGDPHNIHLWNARTGDKLPGNFNGGIGPIAFSPDSTKLATGLLADPDAPDSSALYVRVWGVPGGQAITTLEGMAFASLTFSPDGRQIAGCYGEDLIIWDTETEAEPIRLLGHSGMTSSVSYSPDGTRLASAGSWDNTVRLWETASWEELIRLNHEFMVNDVAFSPDGKTILSGSNGDSIRIWETRNRGDRIQAQKSARQRESRLTPMVQQWIEQANGDTQLLLAMLERETKHTSAEDAVTLRNIVLKSLNPQRHIRD
jgi:WD40 repeat protein